MFGSILVDAALCSLVCVQPENRFLSAQTKRQNKNLCCVCLIFTSLVSQHISKSALFGYFHTVNSTKITSIISGLVLALF